MERAEKRRVIMLALVIFCIVGIALGTPLTVVFALNGLYFPMAIMLVLAIHGFYGISFYYVEYLAFKDIKGCISLVGEGVLSVSELVWRLGMTEAGVMQRLKRAIDEGYLLGYVISGDAVKKSTPDAE